MAPKFKGDITCSLGVRSMKDARQWFQDMLGFELVYEVPDMGWCEITTSARDVTIGLSEVESPRVQGGTTLVFGVLDMDAARGELEAKGVRFDGPTQVIPGMVKLATFFDPDGNKFMLSHNLSASAQ